MDPYDNIRKELGLTQNSLHPPPVVHKKEELHPSDTINLDNKKKRKVPPGYFTNASREQRRINKVLKDYPNYSKEEARDVVKNQIKPRWKPPANYFKKEGFIEREKKKILKIDPTTNSDTISIKTNEAYERHMEKQKAKVKQRRDKLKKAKQYIQSFNNDLADSIQIYYPNTKQAWIERRIANLQKQYPQLQPSEIQKDAQTQYLQKLQKDNLARRKRRAEKFMKRRTLVS